jgi:hypothetical protein
MEIGGAGSQRHGFFMAGSVLLALGFLQSRWEMASLPPAGAVAGLP